MSIVGHAQRHAPVESGAAALRIATASSRVLAVEQDVLSLNNRYAQSNREGFVQRGILALNLMSSPGSGKTTLLVRTVELLRQRVAVAVIEGDQQTDRDAQRIRAAGAPAVQVNTGRGCHLDAHMVRHALEQLPVPDGGVLFIENVGNLVCPAAFDLGEAGKVVVISVTEGDDKPLKYPDIFRVADLLIINKIDLLPYVSFDVQQCIANMRCINPRIEVMQTSATRGDGMQAWIQWIERAREIRTNKASTVPPATSPAQPA